MPTTVPTTLDLQDIGEVATFASASEVNRHLALGWLLLGLSSNQHSEHGYTLNFHLGWRRSLGEAKRAESDMAAWLNEQGKAVESAQERK
jgi:hypothetical protein